MAVRTSYDAAGHIAAIQVDRDGTGYSDVVSDLRYNARGQLSRLTHGNGVVTTREHDADLERLVHIYTSHDDQCRWVKLNSGGDAVRYFRHADQRVLRFVKKGQVRALTVYLGPWEYHSRDGGSGGTTYEKLVLHVHGHGRHAQVERVLSGSDPDSLDIFYHHGDHLGSGHVLTKDDGSLLSQEEFFPYGRSSDRRDARNRYRFIGVERDADTGMCKHGMEDTIVHGRNDSTIHRIGTRLSMIRRRRCHPSATPRRCTLGRRRPFIVRFFSGVILAVLMYSCTQTPDYTLQVSSGADLENLTIVVLEHGELHQVFNVIAGERGEPMHGWRLVFQGVACKVGQLCGRFGQPIALEVPADGSLGWPLNPQGLQALSKAQRGNTVLVVCTYSSVISTGGPQSTMAQHSDRRTFVLRDARDIVPCPPAIIRYSTAG